MTSRLASLVGICGLLLGCTPASSGEAVDGQTTSTDASDAVEVTLPDSGFAYRLELVELGGGDRHHLVAPVPVGRQASVTVSLTSLDETVDVLLEATVLQAGADGESQLVELVIVGVELGVDAVDDGLGAIVGSSSRLVRDGRLSVVEQVVDVSGELSFRADAVARQALRAPFSLVGPFPVDPVGSGASWTVETLVDGDVAQIIEVELVAIAADGYQLRFDMAAGSVEIDGVAGSLLPTEQLITLDDATVRVTAQRISPQN